MIMRGPATRGVSIVYSPHKRLLSRRINAFGGGGYSMFSLVQWWAVLGLNQ